MTDRNIVALKAVRDLIKKHPEKHDQEQWVNVPADLVKFNDGGTALATCGTSACVAGWAVAMAGGKYLINRGCHEAREGVYAPHRVVDPVGNAHLIEVYAAKVLGLTDKEADILFEATNSREEVLDMLKALIKGRKIERPDSDDDR